MLGNVLPKCDKAIGIFVRQWPNQNSIDNTKYRGVGANTEREGDNCNHCHSRIFEKHAEGILQSLHNLGPWLLWSAVAWHRFVTEPSITSSCNKAVPGHRTPKLFVP